MDRNWDCSRLADGPLGDDSSCRLGRRSLHPIASLSKLINPRTRISTKLRKDLPILPPSIVNYCACDSTEGDLVSAILCPRYLLHFASMLSASPVAAVVFNPTLMSVLPTTT